MTEAAAKRTVRIGGFAAFWGDSTAYAAQLIARGRCDYLIGDYLAEITMSLLARAKAKDPSAGYALDIVPAIGAHFGELLAAKSKVVTNAGGLNPHACRDALLTAAGATGHAPRIAIVAGDDLLPSLDAIRALAPHEMFSGAPLPARLASANAYLGAMPIARALAAGADVVICGRVVDSALALGPLAYEFGWQASDYDRLAAGSLLGHVLECGAQGTGGLFTDWRAVPGWDDMGLPIAECASGGTFVVEKPAGTGGLVTPATIAEQIVYEIGDPGAYALPDVVCDFSEVSLEAAGEGRVRVSGARGRAPSASYKVCATYLDGYRVTTSLLVAGGEAAARGERAAQAILTRAARLSAERGFEPFVETSIEVVGGGAIVGDPSLMASAREAVVKIGARHAERGPLELLAREIAPAACAMAQGITGFAAGRPDVAPVIRLFSFLVDKRLVEIRVELDGREIDAAARLIDRSEEDSSAGTTSEHARPAGNAADRDDTVITSPHDTLRTHNTDNGNGGSRTVPLRTLAWGRSGDKGNSANIGIIARHPSFVAAIAQQLTAERVARRFAYVAKGPVTRYQWPGLDAFNFTLAEALGGGGIASLRYDPQGKTFAQILLDEPIAIPANWLRADGTIDASCLEAPDGDMSRHGTLRSAGPA